MLSGSRSRGLCRVVPLTALLVLLAAMLAACGDDDSSTAGSPTVPATITGPASTQAPAPSASPPAASSPTAKPTAAPGKLGTPSGFATTIRDPSFSPLAGAKASWGTIDRAAYQVEIPDNWNGELVLYAHGVRLLGSEVYVSPP